MTAKHAVQRVHVPLDGSRASLDLGEPGSRRLVVVSLFGTVVGEIWLAPEEEARHGAERERILRSSLELARARLLRLAFRRATLGDVAARPASRAPSVTVAAFATRTGDGLAACLQSLAELNTPPHDIVVIDVGQSGSSLRHVCELHGARYLGPGEDFSVEGGARSELLAFVDDRHRTDPRWLDDLDHAFADPLVGAVTGYVEPGGVSGTPADGCQRYERRVLDAFSGRPVFLAASARLGPNVIFRRAALASLGLPGLAGLARSAWELYALDRLLAAGNRVVFDPGRIVWSRESVAEPAEHPALAESAYAVHCLALGRELAAARFWLASLLRHGRPGRTAPAGGEGGPNGPSFPRTIASTAAGIWLGIRSARVARGRSERSPPKPPSERVQTASTVSVRSEQPPLSVIVPSYNRRTLLSEVLRALAQQSYPFERFEVVVVLDGSSDGSAELVRSLEVPYRLQLLEQENRGVAATRNRGVTAAKEPVIVFLDDDLVPEPDFLEVHADAHARAGANRVALGYCPPRVAGSSLWEVLLRQEWEDHFRRKGEPNRPWTYIDFSTGNSSLRRLFFVSSGGFDERFRHRHEEQELGARLVGRGVDFRYAPAARAWHHVDARFKTQLEKQRLEGRYDILLAQKHPHLTSQLTLAALTRAGKLTPRAEFVYRNPEVSKGLAEAGLAALGLLERLGLRRRWKMLAAGLRAHAYVIGIRDALPQPEQLDGLMGRIATELPIRVPVWLDTSGPLRVPTNEGVIELCLGHAGRLITCLEPKRAGMEWDWDEVTDRVVDTAVADVARAVPAEALLATVRGDPSREEGGLGL